MLSTVDDPLSLYSVTRSFIADSLTPIQAYLALAQPGRSCLLESVEGTDRISRFSFIGIDYLEARTFDDDPGMIGHIREMLASYRVDTSDLPFPGGAVCVFTYDAVRQLERIGAKPPADVAFSDALVVVPGTWAVFDHFTHQTTLIGFARDASEEAAVGNRLDGYIATLLSSLPSIPRDVRAAGDVKQSLTRAGYFPVPYTHLTLPTNARV